MRGVADRESALHAGMPVIGMPVLVRHHAHDFLALHLGAEGAPDTTVGAGGDLAVLRLAHLDQRIFRQRRRGAGLHAGAARHAFRIHERHVLAGGHRRVEAPALDRQRQRALLLVAGAHAAGADDAFAGVEREIRIAGVLDRDPVILALVAIADLAQSDDAGHVLQLAVTVGRAREAVERMIGDVQLHHTAADVGELSVLRGHFHAGRDRRGARRRQAFHPLDLHETQAAGTEGLELIGGAQLGNLDVGERGGAHHRSPLRHGDFLTVDGEGHCPGAMALRCTKILFGNGLHWGSSRP